ncbi:DUF1549 domain-containing protein [Novipirellula rosea]|uniref:DUF1549 domain-containing protein n=1 Tax=Novipirellula rosea TaxID=1031540 RepID=UPI0031ED85DA
MAIRESLVTLLACFVLGASVASSQEVLQGESTAGVAVMSSLELADWIDDQIATQQKAAGQESPPIVDDATFMRRVYLDLVGSIPSVPMVRDFLYSTATLKREDLIAQLMRDDVRPENYATRHAEHLARIWRRAMIPPNSPNPQMAAAFEPWLREQFIAKVGYDEIARSLVSPTVDTPPMQDATMRQAISPLQVYYQANGGTSVSSATAVTRYFLGVRIGCAQCHDHPFSSWKESDFWGMAAFFENSSRAGELPSIRDEGGVSHQAKVLWGEVNLDRDQSARDALADWMVSPNNPNFASTAVNRIWQYLCGRGIVDAVDDLDQVSDEERQVLDELGGMFAQSGFDIRWLIEGICNSKFYQRVSLSKELVHSDTVTLRPLKTLTPEQVFDSLEQALALPVGRIDNPPRYNGMRDAFVSRMDEAAGESPEDYRAGVLQALIVMNGKLTADAASLEKSRTLRATVEAPFMSTAEKIETLFLAAFTRLPRQDELDFLVGHIHSQPAEHRNQAYEEVFWGMLNSPEFVLSR